jgi:hypothetical protein
MRRGQPIQFDDSDFDWDASPAPSRREEHTETSRLAWAVLVLLAFGPPLGFALAAVWR